MKKVFYLLAILATIGYGISCSKDNNENRNSNNSEQQGPEDPNNQGGEDPNGNGNGSGPEEPTPPQTCIDNLVIYFSFDNDKLIDLGEGITFKENKGQAALTTGFIGKGWTNKSGNNATEAYSKFDVAAESAFSKIENFTFSAWIKNVEANPKGGIISLNGGRMSPTKPHDFPAFIIYFDNFGEDAETHEKWQQVNGRFIFHDDKGTEQNLWLDTGAPALAVYDEWFHFVVTYEPAAKVAHLYVNGEDIRELAFEPGIPFNNLVTEYANALYIGAWSTFVEGDSVQTWQNYWPGSIDEVRIYNKAFTPEEVTSLYKEELDINLSQED